MNLKTTLLVTNALSILLFFIFLFISYIRMFLSSEVLVLLTFITLLAGAISFVTHLLLINPLLKAVKGVSSEAKRIAEGEFDVEVRETGPKEIQELAKNFNTMSSRVKEMIDDVKESERLKTELIANVSHDLRTPVASIRSHVEALIDQILTDEKTREQYLSTIKQESVKLSELLEEVLQLSQLERGSVPFHPERTKVDELLVSVLSSFERMAEKKGIEFVVQIDEREDSILIVPQQIHRVLSNLIENAIRYSNNGRSITIIVEDLGRATIFRVKDEGEGIPFEEQKNIFDRFYRVEKSRNQAYGGSGLGLAICKEFVTLHGGEIGVKSVKGRGSEFWFTIPKE
ncbi:hypothetical protein Q73_12735 [Bacillus coahuilensis m2-6]|uniref:histidine kinase n=1 Tax=Bacillus coahuilensis p1.1.43 TaxID=1150625 RepID=A0A147K5Z2_9BACI|nr:HAMP domain-containing sensor histidine kinase [Bacillus coahuilensis]KUP05235.1 hypothetical protein Q75_13355 [Bacillus coahuilensis p1.1.43]KUP05686.1 hypothetical protein Q73_12735 [Bacillus coahuilensis m2-6]